MIEPAEMAELLDPARTGPCISIYLPTQRPFPQDQQNATRFRNLLKEVEQSLVSALDEKSTIALMTPLHELAQDQEFWTHATDGLAVFVSPGYFRLVQLQRTPPQIAIVAERFHVKPMLRIVQSADRYQVLALTRRDIRMFEGNRDVLDEIDLAPGVPRTITEALGEEITQKQVFGYSSGTGHVAGSPGGRNYRGMKMGIRHGPVLRDDEIGVDIERFFRAVARAVHEHHSKPSGLPLILAAPAQYHTHFRSVSQNPQLLDRAIDINPAALTVAELRARAWEVMEPEYLRRLSTLLDRYGAAHGAGTATDDPTAAAQAALQGRVGTLLLEAERQIPGRIDSGVLHTADLADSEVNDALDDLAQMVLQTGGQVVIVPTERMPTRTGLAAIFRY
jgi:hypothetical protein